MMRETVVAPLGLITKPNASGQYPAGALSEAINVCMRAPGVVEPLPARDQYAANGGGSDAVMRLWPRESSLLVLSAGALYAVTDSTRDTIALPTGWATSANYSRFMRAKQRDFLTATGGPISITGTTATAVGLAPPASIDCTAYTTGATDQALATARNVNYRAILTRRTATGLISSAPSNILNVLNSSGSTAALDIRVRILTIGNHQVGDVYELYRTESQASGTDPGNRFRLCGSHTLDAGDIAALSVTVTDNCTDAALGADLYCNPGQPSASARHNRCPSIATDMATFKGYTFYATPYSHVRGKFKILGNCGVLGGATARTHGIGRRSQTGDFTNGSPTVLNLTATSGLVIGQKMETSATVPAGTTITNIVGTTLTMSANATATNVGLSFYVYDRIQSGPSGEIYDFINLEGLADLVAEDDTGIIVRTDAYLKQILSGGAVGSGSAVDGPTILFEDVYYAAAGDTPIGFLATNGQNYSQALETTAGGTAYEYPFTPNRARLTVSKFDQPDHVPDENELVIGSGYIHRLIPTTDTLFAFCGDGLYAIEGDAGVFRVRVVDSTLCLATRSSVDVMSDLVWAYTNRGFVSITARGVDREFSTLTIGDLIPGGSITNEAADAAINQLRTFVTCDERNREVRLCIRESGVSTIYLYNALTDKFTTIVDSGSGNEVVAECYAPYLESIVWSPSVTGASTPLYIYETNGDTRSDDAVNFQPLYGTKEPFTLKQWSDFEFLFRNCVSTLTVNMNVNGAQASAAVAGTVENGVRRYVSGMPLDGAMAASVAFGFDTQVDGDEGWQLIGLSARWVPISQQVQK